MARRLQLALLILAALVVGGVVDAFVNRRGLSPRPLIDETNARFDRIEARLADHAAQHGAYPSGEDWAETLGLTADEIADPFHDDDPLTLWSDGRWYLIQSDGPDAAVSRWAQTRSVDPETTASLSRSFHAEFLGNRTPEEVDRLLGDGDIVGDIAFRWAIYDPTNGLVSRGDLVRWGGPVPTE